MTKPRHNLWLAAQQFGAPSEIWILRQIERFEHFSTRGLVWEDHRETKDCFPVKLLNAPGPGLRKLGAKRWLHRAARIPSGNFYSASRSETKKLVSYAKKTGRPDLILAHYGHVALRLLPVARALDVPLIVHFHGTDVSTSLDNNRWYRASLLNALQHFEGIICVGSHQVEKLVELGAFREKISLIPCGVPTRAFKPDKNKKTSGTQFATLSRLVAQKGIDFVLRAIAQVPDAHLTIMGDGPELPNLKHLSSKLGISDRVIFTGTVSPSQARETLSRMDGFVQHSVDIGGASEGFGVSVAEAASMELPVIVSALGGLKDQVRDTETGFIVPMRDVNKMAEAMKKLIDDTQLAKHMGKAGRKNMVENFDIDLQVEKLETFLLSALSK